MKTLIFRTNGNVVNLKTYNLQEIGIAKALRDYNIECDIMYYGGNNSTREEYIRYRDNKIKIIWAKGYNFAGNGVFINIGKYLDQYDIIQVCEYDQLYSRYLAFFSRYKNKVCMTHGPYYNKTNIKYNIKIGIVDRLWVPEKQKKNTWFFAKSVYAKEFLEKRGFEKVVVTGVGLDIERFKDISKENEIIEKIKRFKGNDDLLLYIGQISERRNILFIIELMNELKKKIPNIKLVIVGNGEKKYKNSCFNRIEKLKLADDIYYAEGIEQNQLSSLYKLASAFLLPTKYEIFGMVMLEAMYFGIPLITTDNGGAITVINNGENGFILPLDSEKWVNTIYSIIYDKEKARIISIKERETIIRYYSWNNIVRKMLAEYDYILNNHSVK